MLILLYLVSFGCFFDVCISWKCAMLNSCPWRFSHQASLGQRYFNEKQAMGYRHPNRWESIGLATIQLWCSLIAYQVWWLIAVATPKYDRRLKQEMLEVMTRQLFVQLRWMAPSNQCDRNLKSSIWIEKVANVSEIIIMTIPIFVAKSHALNIPWGFMMLYKHISWRRRNMMTSLASRHQDFDAALQAASQAVDVASVATSHEESWKWWSKYIHIWVHDYTNCI